jgi:hypothetical protein
MIWGATLISCFLTKSGGMYVVLSVTIAILDMFPPGGWIA